MSANDPNILSYATPAPVNRFAQWPMYRIIFLAITVPGLSSSLIRKSPWRCVAMSGTVAAAFIFFGPIWGEILFKNKAIRESGFFPFIAIFVAVEVTSIVLAIGDQKRAIAQTEFNAC